MDQQNAKSDVVITQEIRQAVVGSDRLSFSAKNVTIITRGAQVTLRGAVTTEEKSTIDRLARAVAGAANVDNQLHTEAPN